jgi:hypothetical protein
MFKSYYMESDRSVKKRLWNQESGADTVCQFAGGVEVVRSILIPNPTLPQFSTIKIWRRASPVLQAMH